MKLFWLLSALVAVAASASITQTRVETDGTTDLSGWREKATEVIAKAIATVEIVISKLPEDTTITQVLFSVKDDLRKTLTDIEGTSVTGTLGYVNQFTSLKKILWTLSEVLVRLPEGPLKNHVEQIVNTIRETIKATGFLPQTMHSGVYPFGKMWSKSAYTKLNWREKTTSVIEKVIAHLEFVTSKLTEDSTLKPVLISTLEFLNQKMTVLRDTTMTFTETDRNGMLRTILETLVKICVKLPEGTLKDHMRHVFFVIREVLRSVGTDEFGYDTVVGDTTYTGFNPLTTYTGFNPLTTYTGFNPLTTYTGFNPLATYTGFNPLTTYTGFNPLTTYTVFNPLTTYTGFNPRTTYTGFNPRTTYTGFNPRTTYTGFNPSTTYTGLNPMTMRSGFYPSTTYTGLNPELTGNMWSKSTTNSFNWQAKKVEMIEKAIAHLDFVMSRLPEDFTQKPVLYNVQAFLRKTLTDLSGTTMTFRVANRSALLQKTLESLEEVFVTLPEGPLKDRMQQVVYMIRELRNNSW